MYLRARREYIYNKKAVNHAFGNKCAMVHTALLNGRATYASALPTRCTIVGICRGLQNKIKAVNPFLLDLPLKDGRSPVYILNTRTLLPRLAIYGRWLSLCCLPRYTNPAHSPPARSLYLLRQLQWCTCYPQENLPVSS